jgi:hypothetical protein
LKYYIHLLHITTAKYLIQDIYEVKRVLRVKVQIQVAPLFWAFGEGCIMVGGHGSSSYQSKCLILSHGKEKERMDQLSTLPYEGMLPAT